MHNTSRYMRWMHFRTSQSGGNVVITSNDVFAIVQQGYTMFGPPSVAYIGGTSSSCAFLFAWKNPGTTYYTRCKSASAAAGLTAGTERSHSFPGSSTMSPALGLAGERGMAGHLVAATLGHADGGRTARRAYAAPGSFETGERRKGLKVLKGGKGR